MTHSTAPKDNSELTQPPIPPSTPLSIDRKLRILLEDHLEYWSRPERYTEPLKKGELTFADQIKQIFLEALLQAKPEKKEQSLPLSPHIAWNQAIERYEANIKELFK